METGEAGEAKDVIATCSERAGMDFGGYGLCKLLAELLSLCFSCIMDEMVTVIFLAGF